MGKGDPILEKAAKVLLGDGTNGRILRQIQMDIADGTNAATLTCNTIDQWNGNANNYTNNIAKGATTGIWTLSADGSTLTLESGGLSGNCIAVIAANIWKNESTANIVFLYMAYFNGIFLQFFNATTGAVVDLTTLVNTGSIKLVVTYLTAT